MEGDLGITRHILDKRGGRPDPRREMYDAIADCEAKLAILGEHQRMNGGSLPDWCLICRYQQGPVLGTVPWPCRTVRLLADCYKHRPGWADYWRA